MCETGYADGCREFGRYYVQTTHVANPGLTPVTLEACQDHLAEAVTEMLAANASLRAQGMRTLPGLRLGHLDLGVSVIAVAPDEDDDEEDRSPGVKGYPYPWTKPEHAEALARAEQENAEARARYAQDAAPDTGRNVIADDAQLSRIESSACDR